MDQSTDRNEAAETPSLRQQEGESSGSKQARSRAERQVRKRDTSQPIAPPADADQIDEEWSAMNWKTTLKELCDSNLSLVKRRLRRIHLRWYHVTAAQVARLPDMVGCPDEVLGMIPDIVATCRVCRTWTRRAPDTKLAMP